MCFMRWSSISESCEGDASTFTKFMVLGMSFSSRSCFKIKPVPPPRSAIVWGWFVCMACLIVCIKGKAICASEKYPLCMVFHLFPYMLFSFGFTICVPSS